MPALAPQSSHSYVSAASSFTQSANPPKKLFGYRETIRLPPLISTIICMFGDPPVNRNVKGSANSLPPPPTPSLGPTFCICMFVTTNVLPLFPQFILDSPFLFRAKDFPIFADPNLIRFDLDFILDIWAFESLLEVSNLYFEIYLLSLTSYFSLCLLFKKHSLPILRCGLVLLNKFTGVPICGYGLHHIRKSKMKPAKYGLQL